MSIFGPDPDHPLKCGSCRRVMQNYDADRGWSCGNPKCPRALREERELRADMRTQEAHLSRLRHLPAGRFTVNELIVLLEDFPDGRALRAIVKRIGSRAAKDKHGA